MTILGGSSRFLCASLSVILSLAAGDASRAAPRPDGSVGVSVGDLDFSNARDVELFRRRVDRAARTLCGRQAQLDFLETNACYRGVRDQVVRKLADDQRRRLLATSGKFIW